MRIALCDDDWVQLDILTDAVKKCKHWRGEMLETDRFELGSELLDAIRLGKEYEYVFLDIEMPWLSGFDTYSELAALCESSIVFVSTHIELLPEAFSFRPYGFLPKPYSQDAFDRTVNSVIGQRSDNQFFQFVNDGVKETVQCRNILFFVAEDYMLSMHRINKGCTILQRRKLDVIEHELSGFGFFRCNRAVLVNLRHCSGRKENSLIMKHTDSQIAISRRRLKEFDRQLALYRMGDVYAF